MKVQEDHHHCMYFDTGPYWKNIFKILGLKNLQAFNGAWIFYGYSFTRIMCLNWNSKMSFSAGPSLTYGKNALKILFSETIDRFQAKHCMHNAWNVLHFCFWCSFEIQAGFMGPCGEIKRCLKTIWLIEPILYMWLIMW